MLKFIHTKNFDILSQLKLEESLLKNTKDSFCLINEGTKKTIILGVSNKSKELIKLKNAKKDKIPIIKITSKRN